MDGSANLMSGKADLQRGCVYVCVCVNGLFLVSYSRDGCDVYGYDEDVGMELH